MITGKLTKVEHCRCGAQSFNIVALDQFYSIECRECQNYGPVCATRAEAVSAWNKKQVASDEQQEEEKTYVH